MPKFGEIISSDVPVLIQFVSTLHSRSEESTHILRDLAAKFGDYLKVIIIDTDKNETLSSAIRIKNYPTFILYKKAQMVYRATGEHTYQKLHKIITDNIQL